MIPELPGAVPEIPVSDVTTAAAYYRDCLRFTLDWVEADIALAGISRDTCRLFLAGPPFRNVRGNGSPIVMWLNLDSKDEVDALHHSWRASNAIVLSAPESTSWGLHEFTAADPDGNLFRVFYDFETPERERAKTTVTEDRTSSSRIMPDGYSIRLALPADATTIAAHRVGMFRDMHRLTPSSMEPLFETSRTWLGPALGSGEYVGWLAVAPDGSVVAGAGVQRRQVLPFPRASGDGSVRVLAGRSAVVVNVYTDPAHRRRGLARRLMEQVLEWADTELDDLVLHAAPDGRHLYESLGFAATNEMRYRGAPGGGSETLRPLGSSSQR